MDTCTRNAYAKINLGLDVVGVLENGYHEVKMIMQNVEIYDTLTFEKRADDQITLEANTGTIPLDENNLIYKAVMLLRTLTGNKDGVHIKLEKRIPVAAGMAGGSTDAAATLLGVNELLGLGLSEQEIMKESVKIGADVPYCVLGRTALSEGIGEILTPIAKPTFAHLVVAKPDINVSTPYVYKKLDEKKGYQHPDIDGMVKALENQDLDGVISRLGNVLEYVTIEEYPIVAQIKETMLQNGAKGALMSGSGPSTFGIFDDLEKAKKAAKEISDKKLAPQAFVTEFA